MSAKVKKVFRKKMNSKQLLIQGMCSYQDWNHLYLVKFVNEHSTLKLDDQEGGKETFIHLKDFPAVSLYYFQESRILLINLISLN